MNTNELAGLISRNSLVGTPAEVLAIIQASGKAESRLSADSLALIDRLQAAGVIDGKVQEDLKKPVEVDTESLWTRNGGGDVLPTEEEIKKAQDYLASHAKISDWINNILLPMANAGKSEAEISAELKKVLS